MSWRMMLRRAATVSAAIPMVLAGVMTAPAVAGSDRGTPTTTEKSQVQYATIYLTRLAETTYTEVYVETGDHWYAEGGTTDLGPYLSVSQYTLDLTTEEPTVVSEQHGLLTGVDVSFGARLSSAAVSEVVPMYATDAEEPVMTPVSATWLANARAMRDSEHVTQGVPGVWVTTTSGQGKSRTADATLVIGDVEYRTESPDSDYASISTWQSVSHTVGTLP